MWEDIDQYSEDDDDDDSDKHVTAQKEHFINTTPSS